MLVKVSDYIAEFMVEHGVVHVFTVTGGGAMHLNDSFGHKNGLTCIYNHHEQACAIAAEGYARLSGRVALVCVTSGPGGTNAITGVVGGWQDSIPMFVISGQVKRETTTWATDVPLRQLGDQEFQIIESVRNMTKYSVMVTEPKDIRYHLKRAWYMCNNGRKGPVWIDIPIDVQAAMVDTDEMRDYDPVEDDHKQKPVYDKAITPKIITKIREAKRPVLLVGTGVRLAGASKELLETIDKLRIPVVTAWNAHDLLSDDNPYYCGRPGSVGTRGGNFVVQNSDLLLVLGCRLNIRQISYNYKSFAKNAYKIVVDIDEAELKKPTVHIDMPVHADLKDVVEGILKSESNVGNHTDWLKWCREINHKYPADLPEYYGREKLNPYVFIKKFTEQLRDDDTIVCGNGSACVITFQSAVIKQGQRLFTNSGCAAMGYGFPAALGACVARNNEKTICIDGDGSFMMNLQELQTVRYNNLNLKIIIINNNGYHSIRQTQTNLFNPPLVGVSEGNGISFPDFEKVAYAFDIPYLRIQTEKEVSEVTNRMFEKNGPVLCEIIVDENQNFEPKLSSRRLDDGTMISPEIDDMYPFMSREEYESNHVLNAF